MSWTAGCLLLLLHVGLAFAYHHGWSHTAAYEHTAKQTENVIGLSWGGGLWINYLFLLIWVIDACMWWINRERYESRSVFVDRSIQIAFAFMFLNAAVVFANGFGRWWGILLFGILICVVLMPRNRQIQQVERVAP